MLLFNHVNIKYPRYTRCWFTLAVRELETNGKLLPIHPPTIQSLMAVQWLLVHSGCQLQMHTNHHYYHHPKYINVLNKHIYTVYTVYYIVCYAFYPSLDS